MLVTGASGFIGGRLALRLIERGCRVACLVRAGSRVDALRAAGAELITGDVTDPGSVGSALARSQAELVFHLAGLTRARRSGDFMRVNEGGVGAVAGACAHRNLPPTLVVVSSLAAAGACAPERARLEGDIPAPVSQYGRSKLGGEHAARKHAGAAPITIVRPPIVFGPGDRGTLEIFRSIARWGVHVVPGRGDHRLSLVHVDDLVEGLLLAAEKGERLGEFGSQGRGVYFLAAEEAPTHAELGLAIARALGRGSPALVRLPGAALRLLGVGGDLLARTGRRPGWINSDKFREALAGSWVCSSAKARDELGWRPAAPLADCLRETAEWYRLAAWL